MAFPNFFPSQSTLVQFSLQVRSLFAETIAYVKAFALPFIESGYIRLSYEVIGVEELEGGCGWAVHSKWNKGGAVLEETWDAVVITIMCFCNPYFLDVQGLQHHQPNKIQHSITWRGPHEGQVRKVLPLFPSPKANTRFHIRSMCSSSETRTPHTK